MYVRIFTVEPGTDTGVPTFFVPDFKVCVFVCACVVFASCAIRGPMTCV